MCLHAMFVVGKREFPTTNMVCKHILVRPVVKSLCNCKANKSKNKKLAQKNVWTIIKLSILRYTFAASWKRTEKSLILTLCANCETKIISGEVTKTIFFSFCAGIYNFIIVMHALCTLVSKTKGAEIQACESLEKATLWPIRNNKKSK